MFDNLETFAGKRVEDFKPDEGLGNPQEIIPRLRVEFESEDTGVDLLRDLLGDPRAEHLTGLSIGAWTGDLVDETPAEIIEALVAAADQLPNLRALFICDIAQEENEVSWIQQCDLSALWDAFPRLEVLGIRGSGGLSLGKLRLNHLRELILENGGLPKSVLAELANASLPVLERLEIYLGDDSYGWDGTADDLAPILSGKLFPKLKYLGLRNSCIQDEVAKAVATSPIVERLEELDLSLGTLGDEGAEALLASPAIKKLKKLDLHHHYMSEPVANKFAEFGPEVDVSEQEDEGRYGRYVSVGE